MTMRLVHVSFGFAGVPKVLDLEPVVSALSDDWIRYSTTNWILWTSLDNDAILFQLLRRIDLNDTLFVSEIEYLVPSSSGGWLARLQPWVWTWLEQKTGPGRLQWIRPDNTKSLAPPK